MQYNLSVLIPANNEEFLARTVQDLIENKTDKTEIIVGLDSKWANPPIPQHPDVNIIYVPEVLGQRAMTKLCAKLSKAKYIAKVDAHCSFDKGFDSKMIEGFEKMGDNVVMIPVMKNLHVYDWKCPKCGHKEYQDREDICPIDGTKMKKKMIWQPRRGTNSTSYCFDATPHFQYFTAYKDRPEYTKMKDETGFTESMALQGSFFMMTREKYFEFGTEEENFGSWGAQGIQWACAFWLSGGRVLINHNTWYSHCFRTKPHFSFPYENRGSENTKRKVWEFFFSGKFKQQKYPVSWLVEKFWPVPGWTEEDLKKIK